MPSRARTRPRLPCSRRRAGPCDGGSSATITSAASALSGETERAPIRAGAASRCRFGRETDRNPAHVTADRAAGVLLHGASRDRFRVDLAALEAPDALEDRERTVGGVGGFHVTKDAISAKNLRSLRF